MEIEQSLSSIHVDVETNSIIPNSSVVIKNRFRSFFGLPKLIGGEQVDHENCSWCMLFCHIKSNIFLKIILALNTFLCASIFLEDAVNYRSIVHKVTKYYLFIYRWSSCPLIRK